MWYVLQIELYKLIRQKRTYYGLAAIFIIESIIILAAYAQGSEILSVLLESLTERFIMTGDLLNGHLVMYIMLNSLWFNLPLIIMILVSGFLTSEYKDKTVQATLLQAVSKRDFIIAKYLTALIFTVFIMIVLGLSSGLLSYAIFGTGDLITYLDGLNFFSSQDAFQRLALAFFQGGLLMLSYAIISITLAVFFKDQAVTWIVCAFVLVMNGLLVKVDLGQLNDWVFPKITDTWQYYFQFELPSEQIWHNSLLIIFYSLVIMFAGIIKFNKTEIG